MPGHRYVYQWPLDKLCYMTAVLFIVDLIPLHDAILDGNTCGGGYGARGYERFIQTDESLCEYTNSFVFPDVKPHLHEISNYKRI